MSKFHKVIHQITSLGRYIFCVKQDWTYFKHYHYIFTLIPANYYGQWQIRSRVSELSSHYSKRERYRKFRKPAARSNENGPLQISIWSKILNNVMKKLFRHETVNFMKFLNANIKFPPVLTIERHLVVIWDIEIFLIIFGLSAQWKLKFFSLL